MTGTPPAAVVALDPTDRTRAGGVLGHAFHDDPLWSALVPDPEIRNARLPLMFSGTVTLTAAARGVAERTEGFEAVALWLPPGRTIGPWAMVRSGFAGARWALRPPFQDLRPMMSVLRQFDQRHKALAPDPHWYLMAIGVEPRYQGTGCGSALVRAGMQRADGAGTAVYLETETEGNVRFYQGLGFEVIEELTLTAIDLPVWLMIRRPGG